MWNFCSPGGQARVVLQDPESTVNSLVWKAYGPKMLDGWLYGIVDKTSAEFTGNDLSYIYSDFITAFLGRFDKGVMLNASPAKISAYR